MSTIDDLIKLLRCSTNATFTLPVEAFTSINKGEELEEAWQHLNKNPNLDTLKIREIESKQIKIYVEVIQ